MNWFAVITYNLMFKIFKIIFLPNQYPNFVVTQVALTVNLSRHVSGHYTYPTHLNTPTWKHLCKCFAKWAIIEEFTDMTPSAVQRFNYESNRKPATALLLCQSADIMSSLFGVGVCVPDLGKMYSYS